MSGAARQSFGRPKGPDTIARPITRSYNQESACGRARPTRRGLRKQSDHMAATTPELDHKIRRCHPRKSSRRCTSTIRSSLQLSPQRRGHHRGPVPCELSNSDGDRDETGVETTTHQFEESTEARQERNRGRLSQGRTAATFRSHFEQAETSRQLSAGLGWSRRLPETPAWWALTHAADGAV